MASPSSLPRLIAMGYRFLSMGADVVALGEYFKQVKQSFDEHVAQ